MIHVGWSARSATTKNDKSMQTYDDAARIFLGLSRLRGVGFKRLRELGGVEAIAKQFAQTPAELLTRLTREAPPREISSEVFKLGDGAISTLEKHGIGMLRMENPAFPFPLRMLDESIRPFWLFYKGDLALLHRGSVAVVGTRNPTEVGTYLTRYAVSCVAEVGSVVISGLAKGIDEIAHEWALASRVPNISILGNGLLRAYPMRNAELANRIVHAGGLLISEYMPDAQPNAESFVWRNRLQAALARVVIAPEWKASSGTAHTIRFARRLSVPTINLRPTGYEIPQGHGEADFTHEVPKEHNAVICRLRAVIPSAQTTDRQQGELFGPQ